MSEHLKSIIDNTNKEGELRFMLGNLHLIEDAKYRNIIADYVTDKLNHLLVK